MPVTITLKIPAYSVTVVPLWKDHGRFSVCNRNMI